MILAPKLKEKVVYVNEFVEKEYRINTFLTLRLEWGQTVIYINNKRFDVCKRLIFEIYPNEIAKYDSIDSIDEAVHLHSTIKRKRNNGIHSSHLRIDRETEFWGHCSNLEAWYENGYDTRILHKNLAFPLLKKLAEVGDPDAKSAFQQEIISRINSGYEPVIEYILEMGYVDQFDEAAKLELYDTIDNTLKTRKSPFLKQILDQHNDKLWNLRYMALLPEEKDILSLLILNLPGFEEMDRITFNGPRIRGLNLSQLKLNSTEETGEYRSREILHSTKYILEEQLDSIAKLHSLQELSLSNNYLRILPESIGKLSSLEELDLENCNLALLPESIGDLQALRWLSLDGNDITLLPESIMDLHALEYLCISNNPRLRLDNAQAKWIKELRESGILHSNLHWKL
ncbi:MAG: leucine-rich repeat domain-containing protein [Candidatus Hodarchaeota archaeon]